MIEKSLVLVKPDGVKRQIVGDIIKRFEKVGLKIIGMKMVHVNKEFAEEHYMEHKEKDFFNVLNEFLVSGPVVAMVLEGVEAVENVRKITGDTYPHEALPGTIRGDYCHISKVYTNKKNIVVPNVIHASADKNDAEKEISLWFKDEELYDYPTVHDEFTR